MGKTLLLYFLGFHHQYYHFFIINFHRTCYRYFIKESGAAEDKIESFITNVSSSDVSPENIVQYVIQSYAVSSEQSIPPDQVPNYIKQKLE